MVRLLACALVAVWVGSADAGPKRKVKVVTVPAGATVYIGETEQGPACAPTPCSIDVAAGETSIVIDLKDYQREYVNVVVPKKGKIPDAKFTLRAALGTIVIDGPVGATVSIDDVDQGKAPTTTEVAAEGHHVVITLRGKTIYDDYVDVTPGAEVNVAPKKVATGGDGAASGGGGGEGGQPGEGNDGEVPGEGGEEENNEGEITEKVTPRVARDRYVSLSALIDIGFRAFTYGNAVGSDIETGSFDEAGQVLVGPSLELWPGSMAGIRFLRGLSIVARYQYGLNKQPVAAVGLMMKTNTFWQSLEVSVRHRWTFVERVTAELGGGYVRDQYQFEGLPADVARVPDTDYRAIRIGARVSVLLPFNGGRVEPFLTFDNRAIQSGGSLKTKFTKADPSGFRASIGVDARFGKITARIEAAAIQYSWELVAGAMSPVPATSATDAIRVIGLSAGYEY